MTPAEQIAALQKRLDDITKLCQGVNHSGVNLETHRLAHEVLKIAEGGKR